jgi:ubiquinone/menaquinone biosynthesis C-methylase UbiE/biotin operon repressor
MPSIVKILRAAADPTRLRLLMLLKDEELSVAELQEILAMGQSTISSHLSQLKQAGLAQDRRTGKSNFYRLSAENAAAISAVIDSAHKQVPEAVADRAAMRRVVKKRQDKMRAFFDSMAGRLGKDYVPGKSWKSYAEAFLSLLSPMVVADLGAGDGSFALMLARRAEKVIAVDTSEKMVEVGREQALRAGFSHVDFRLGDMEELPIEDTTADLAFFSQSLHHAAHPARALTEAARILKVGGRVVILDLLKHRFEEARELYADEWLGFGEAELEQMLHAAGFTSAYVSIVDRQSEPPNFQTVMAVAQRPT